MQEALDVASRSRTTVCIAHRLSTIKHADNIIVMSHGRIVEQGTHDELYARDGMYRGLVDAQRISAESTGGGGEETPEVVEEEDVLHRARSHSISRVESPPLLHKITTRRSASVAEVKDLESGVVEKTKYPIYTLLKKVKLVPSCINYRLWLSTKRSIMCSSLAGSRLF